MVKMKLILNIELLFFLPIWSFGNNLEKLGQLKNGLAYCKICVAATSKDLRPKPQNLFTKLFCGVLISCFDFSTSN